jgi:hypothetical protein
MEEAIASSSTLKAGGGPATTGADRLYLQRLEAQVSQLGGRPKGSETSLPQTRVF